MIFEIIQNNKNSNARTGKISTTHGTILTPVFMPVGTLGSVKAVHQRELKDDLSASVILGNTYHLFLRPGTEVIKQAGGLHKFIGWNGNILTDSGGYQVFSLSEKRKINREGVTFQSHIDGSKHVFTPENVVDIQREIGADIIMALDECTAYPCSKKEAGTSMELTHHWLERGIHQFKKTHHLYDGPQTFFPIVQGSVFKDLRKKSAEVIASHDMEGNAIGGLSVGEPAEDMYQMIDVVNGILPHDKPRYLMGVGTPVNILEAIDRGVDMFDCVMPTRNGRNGMLFTQNGIINIKNKKWMHDYSPVDPNGNVFVDTAYSKSYLRHLIVSKEILGAQIASLHNLGFYLWLMQEARDKINEGVFKYWKDKIIHQLDRKL